jgi:hypothetical protein
MTTTAPELRLLVATAGLTIADAARVCATDDRTFRRWINEEIDSRNGQPFKIRDEALEPLHRLIAKQEAAADRLLERVRERIKESTRERIKESTRKPKEIRLRLARDDAEAQKLGWPSAAAHAAVLRRVAERAAVKIVPHYQFKD